MNNQPVIALRELEGNEPTHLVPLQEAMSPYIDVFVLLWAAIFFSVVAYMATRYVLLPLLGRRYD